MQLPVVLESFGCGEQGLEAPVSFGGTVTPLPTTSFFKDAMPLVEVPKETILENLVDGYKTEFDSVDFQIGPSVVRNLAMQAGTVEFDEYHLTYNSNEPQPVYALTTGHLYYLHDEKSYEDLLSGAKPDAGEIMLVIRPLLDAPMHWAETHPGRTLLLDECVYLNVQLLSDEDLKALIRRSATEIYLKELYKDITGTEWVGPGDWVSDYLQNFYLYPDWPILVDGGIMIALTKSNPDLTSEQLIKMFFKVGSTWSAHYDFVKSFFKYRQRELGLSGHPLIARLMGYSVETGTVDIIPFNREGEKVLYRSKYNLKEDFKYYLSQPDPEYHPLAIEADEEPQCITVPVPSEYSMFPTPVLRPDQFLTRLKINNPFGLSISITGNIPAGVTITPANFSATEQVVIIQTSGEVDPGITESAIEIKTPAATICTLIIKYLGFRIVPVKFWKIRDNNSNHITQMDEAGLNNLVSIVNDILGRQTNVYVEPKGLPGALLNDLLYDGDLGDDITTESLVELSAPISNSMEDKEINVLFAWHVENKVNEGMVGGNYTSDGKRLIVINTNEDPGDNFNIATIVVHELGHWFSEAFICPIDETATQCMGSDRHFSHVQSDLEGCPGGDWTFYENLMVPNGTTLFITIEQARVFNDFADQVL